MMKLDRQEKRSGFGRTNSHWLLLSFCLLLSVLGGYVWGQAQESAVSKPSVREQVVPKVFEGDLKRVPTTRPYKEGDKVKVIEDLKEMSDSEKASVQEPVVPSVTSTNANKLPKVPPRKAGEPVEVVQDLRQSADTLVAPSTAPRSASSIPPLGVSFDGIPATGYLPPDVAGAVGPDHYILMVNVAFAIYDKQGHLLAGPSPINALWAGFGGPCTNLNSGDPIVRYDHLAGRWLMSQFALAGGAAGYHECVAISRTADPVGGGWFLYDFPTNDAAGRPVFPDYPKIGVWTDAYYMGTQRGFPGGGLDVWAFERDKMLTGSPARVVQFTVAPPSLFLLPADLDGPPPPAGTPNFFGRQVDGPRFGGASRLEVYAFHVNWLNPATSTFSLVASLPTAPFSSTICQGSLIEPCIPQPSTAVKLESLAVWTMWRLQYRNFGTHETLVTNHTINASQGTAGIRWYELRRPPAGTWSIFQQGTHSPDSAHRWMGSIAMDKSGTMALGYSVSSSSIFPSIRYSTHLASDPPGTMGPEGSLIAGGGSQTYSIPRWGNYTTMDVDPKDDCTFWYSGEYMPPPSSAAGWRTRVASFKDSTCGETEYMYSAKLLCGLQKSREDTRLTAGFYATIINVHNPSTTPTTFSKKLALAIPPGSEEPGKVLPIAVEKLEPDGALAVDCEDIHRRLFPKGFPSPYIDGFVVIQSNQSLDVTAVYTTATVDEDGRPSHQSGIEVQQVRERTVNKQ
jgi:hypothetical protein